MLEVARRYVERPDLQGLAISCTSSAAQGLRASARARRRSSAATAAASRRASRSVWAARHLVPVGLLRSDRDQGWLSRPATFAQSWTTGRRSPMRPDGKREAPSPLLAAAGAQCVSFATDRFTWSRGG